MLPSLKSRYDFASNSCICAINVSFSGAAGDWLGVRKGGYRAILPKGKGDGTLAMFFCKVNGGDAPAVIPSEVERSLDESFTAAPRDPSTSLGMTIT